LQEEDTTVYESVQTAAQSEEAQEREEEREIARRDGWEALGWSFAVSAIMTVRVASEKVMKRQTNEHV
jgi:hypothetical protein